MPFSWTTALCLAQVPITLVSGSQVPLRLSPTPQSHTQGYEFDPLLHLPGISPYFDAIGAGLNHKAPRNCEVTAASYLVRHAAIYANDDDYEKYIEPVLKKIDTTYASTFSGKRRKGWTGPFEFLENWKTPIDNPKKQMEMITPQGKKDSKKVGKHLLSRYPKLVPTCKKIYADKKDRTQDTAKAFSKAFPQKVEIIEIKNENVSFHSQVPHKACNAFTKEPGAAELDEFIGHYTAGVIDRLQQYSPVTLEPYDIMGLQQMCGYESAINGKVSPICDVFTDDEWMAYEYAWDLKYFYMVGHGNPLSPYLGFPWLNTTASLMAKFHAPLANPGLGPGISSHSDVPDDDGQRFFISFTHREVPPFIATALGLFNSSNAFGEEFPTDRINWSRSWKMSELIPFLGHVGIEKITCNKMRGDTEKGEEFIRIIANTSPRPIPSCQNGPGASCAIEDFLALVVNGMKEYGDFDGICNNSKKSY